MATLSEVKPLSAYTLDDVMASLRAPLLERRNAGDELSRPERRLLSEGYLGEDFDVEGKRRGLFDSALADAGYVRFDNSGGGYDYLAKVAQYGEGKTFGGDVRRFLQFRFGEGTSIVHDDRLGLDLIKAGDPSKAKTPTPIALPGSDSWFRSFAIPAVTYITAGLSAGYALAGGLYALGAEGIAAPASLFGGTSATSAAVSEAEFLAADASQLSAQGLSQAQVASTLEFSGTSSFAAADAAQLAAQGIGPGQLGDVLAQSYGADLSGATMEAGASASGWQSAKDAISSGKSASDTFSSGNLSTVTKTVTGATSAAGAALKAFKGGVMPAINTAKNMSAVPPEGMTGGAAPAPNPMLDTSTRNALLIAGAIIVALYAMNKKGG